MTKAKQQGKTIKLNKPTWLGKSIWLDKTSLLVEKQFSVANEHEKLKCHNDKSIILDYVEI